MAWHFESADALISRLSRCDVRVPPRTEKRESAQVELWAMQRFMLHCADTGNFDYPIKVEHLRVNDPPDFKIKTTTQEVGVECVEAVSSDAAQLQAKREKSRNNGVFLAENIRPKDDGRPKEEIDDLVCGGMEFDGFCGSMASQWAEDMFCCIRPKILKYHPRQFSSLSAMWLLVYDNLEVSAQLGLLDQSENTEALQNLTEKICALKDHCFHKIFIIMGHEINEISTSG